MAHARRAAQAQVAWPGKAANARDFVSTERVLEQECGRKVRKHGGSPTTVRLSATGSLSVHSSAVHRIVSPPGTRSNDEGPPEWRWRESPRSVAVHGRPVEASRVLFG